MRATVRAPSRPLTITPPPGCSRRGWPLRRIGATDLMFLDKRAACDLASPSLSRKRPFCYSRCPLESFSLATKLPINAQRVGGALLPGEGFDDGHGVPAETVPPIVVFDDALHSLAPTVDVERFDQVRLLSNRLGDGAGGRGQDGAAAGQHFYRRQAEPLVQRRKYQGSRPVVQRRQVRLRHIVAIENAALPGPALQEIGHVAGVPAPATDQKQRTLRPHRLRQTA